MRRTSASLAPKLVSLRFPAKSPYADSTRWEVLRAALSFATCGCSPLVDNATKIIPVCERVFGSKLLYDVVIKKTLFGHFCAGENKEEVLPRLQKLAEKNIHPIVDYAAEAPLSTASKEITPVNVDLNDLLRKDRRVTYAPDPNLEANVRQFEQCIDISATTMKETGSDVAFAAIKVTGLCDPQLLARTTAVLLALRQSWGQYFIPENGGVAPPLMDCRDVCGRCAKAADPRRCKADAFRAGLRAMVPQITDAEVEAVLGKLDTNRAGFVHYFDYTKELRPLILSGTTDAGVLSPIITVLPRLTPEESKLNAEYDARVDKIVNLAHAKKVRLLIDAEQTYYQLAIDSSVRQLQRKYNLEFPCVYNTYQGYLKFSYKRVVNDLARAERQGFIFAGKIVRGAYMNTERLDAAKFGYESPIHISKAATHVNYDLIGMKLLDEVERGVRMGIMFGSHNAHSLEKLANRTAELHGASVKNVDVTFGQLYGMGDHLTVPLAQAGHKVFKYLPYGPVKETILYLIRRGVENKDMMKQSAGEWPLLRQAIKEKFFFR